jgi:hypothetical protein
MPKMAATTPMRPVAPEMYRTSAALDEVDELEPLLVLEPDEPVPLLDGFEAPLTHV